MRKSFLPLILMMLAVLTGCAHQSPFADSDEYFFQAMGKDSEIVLTADSGKIRQTLPSALETGSAVLNELFDRSTRISVAFYKDSYGGEADYPANLADFDYYGGLEGNYGSFTINTALAWSGVFHKEKEEGIKYYTDDQGSIQVAVPDSGILLFASQSYVQAYRDLIEERIIRISDETAARIGSSLFGIYVHSPQTMIDLGFELPYSVIVKMSDAVIYVNESEGKYYLSADITMQSEDLAATLLQLLRQQVVGELRRQGIRPDYQLLSQQYSSDGTLVMIRDFELTEDQMLAFFSRIENISGGVF